MESTTGLAGDGSEASLPCAMPDKPAPDGDSKGTTTANTLRVYNGLSSDGSEASLPCTLPEKPATDGDSKGRETANTHGVYNLT